MKYHSTIVGKLEAMLTPDLIQSILVHEKSFTGFTVSMIHTVTTMSVQALGCIEYSAAVGALRHQKTKLLGVAEQVSVT
jgi:hypothetical protein